MPAAFLAVISALLLLCPAVRAQDAVGGTLREQMKFAREAVYPALVNISIVEEQFSQGRAVRFPAAGSGVIVSPGGYVVTNFHVAGHATRIVCRLTSNESIDATVVANDPLTDLSILKLDLASRKDKNEPIPFARLGDSDRLHTGDYVLAMGNPLTLSSSMTLGIVSNPRRIFASFTGSNMQQMDLGGGQVTGLFTRWIQHDALILPGNSGGPLVNLQGEVVGINELGGNGVGFAIPSNLVAKVLNKALSGGKIVRGWFGVTLYPVGKMNGTHGVLVSSIQPEGPAEKAGIRPGDVLLSANKKKLDGLYFEQIPPLYEALSEFAPGTKVTLRYVRNGTEKTAEVTVAKMQPYLAPEHEVRKLGISVRDITGPMALVRRYPDSRGVLVTGIRPGYPADGAKPRIRSGDVIRDLDGKAVNDYAELEKVVAHLGDRSGILVQFRRKDEDMITTLDTSKQENEFNGGELPQAWIGIQTQVLTSDVAKALDMKGTQGFRVTQVYPGTEAAKAGLKVGDVITALNGDALHAFRVQDSEILKRRVENLTIGDKAELSILRDGKKKDVEVVLQETPTTSAEVKSAEDAFLEYKVRGIAFRDKVKNRWPLDQTGVLVTSVTSGGWASLAGLQSGDLIQKIDGVKIENIDDFKEAVKRIGEKKPNPVSIFVIRGYRTAFVFVRPDYGPGAK